MLKVPDPDDGPNGGLKPTLRAVRPDIFVGWASAHRYARQDKRIELTQTAIRRFLQTPRASPPLLEQRIGQIVGREQPAKRAGRQQQVLA